MHRQAMGKHEFTKVTMTRTWGNHHLPPYSILYAWPKSMHPNAILSRNSQVGSPEIFEIETFATLKAHNFLSEPSIEASSKATLQPSSRPFQRYVVNHLHIRNQGDSILLVVGSKIDNLIPNPSFGHNLYFKHLNGSCEPI